MLLSAPLQCKSFYVAASLLNACSTRTAISLPLDSSPSLPTVPQSRHRQERAPQCHHIMEANSPSKTRGSARSRVYLSGPAAAQHVRCVGLGVGPAQDEEHLPHWNNTVQLFFVIEFSAVKAESHAQQCSQAAPESTCPSVASTASSFVSRRRLG